MQSKAVSGVIQALAYLFPYKASPEDKAIPYFKLYNTYAKWEILPNLIGLASVPLLTFLYHKLLLMIQGAYLAPLKPVDGFLIAPDNDFWWGIAFGFGLSSMIIPVHIGLKLALGERLRLFKLYCCTKLGFDSYKCLAWICSLFGAGCLVVAFMALHTYLVLAPNEIVVSKMLSLTPRHYQYSQVKTVRFVPHHNPKRKIPDWKETVIEFDDGNKWSSEEGLGSEISVEQTDLLIKRAQLRIVGATS